MIILKHLKLYHQNELNIFRGFIEHEYFKLD